MAEEGVPFDEHTFRRTFGQRNDTIIADVMGPKVAKQRIAAIAAAKERRYRTLIAQEGIEALPGALEWIRRLHAREIPQAVVSSAPPENIHTILEALAAGAFFQKLVSGEEVRRGKPDPESFLLAAQRLGVPPARCVVVEDAPAGLEAARRAGMAGIGLTTTHPAEELAAVGAGSAMPLRIFDSLAGLPEGVFEGLIEAATG